MRRPTREELDQSIVDCAALLFARHGYAHTSVQQIADAVGYSKTGLLHRFPTKESLREAVTRQFEAELDAVVAAVDAVPPGRERDLAVVRALVGLTLRRRATIALAVTALGAHERPEDLVWLNGIAHGLFRAFEGTAALPQGPSGPPDVLADVLADDQVDVLADGGRRARVYGALGALAVVSLATPPEQGARLRDVLVATAYGALGHGEPPADGS